MEQTKPKTQNNDLKIVIIAILGLLALCMISALCLMSFNYLQNRSFEKKVIELQKKEMGE